MLIGGDGELEETSSRQSFAPGSTSLSEGLFESVSTFLGFSSSFLRRCLTSWNSEVSLRNCRSEEMGWIALYSFSAFRILSPKAGCVAKNAVRLAYPDF